MTKLFQIIFDVEKNYNTNLKNISAIALKITLKKSFFVKKIKLKNNHLPQKIKKMHL